MGTNTRKDRFQVQVFDAFFKSAKKRGKSYEEAFILALTKTSDEVVDKLPEGSIEVWEAFRTDRQGFDAVSQEQIGNNTRELVPV